MFGQIILPIPFHSKLFQTIQLSNPTNHSIPFFFNLFFQLSKSLYNIFKSQPFIPLRNSQSQTIQHIFFFKPFQTILPIPKNGMGWAKWFAQTHKIAKIRPFECDLGPSSFILASSWNCKFICLIFSLYIQLFGHVHYWYLVVTYSLYPSPQPSLRVQDFNCSNLQ